jgi:hypothetical protein
VKKEEHRRVMFFLAWARAIFRKKVEKSLERARSEAKKRSGGKRDR